MNNEKNTNNKKVKRVRLFGFRLFNYGGREEFDKVKLYFALYLIFAAITLAVAVYILISRGRPVINGTIILLPMLAAIASNKQYRKEKDNKRKQELEKMNVQDLK